MRCQRNIWAELFYCKGRLGWVELLCLMLTCYNPRRMPSLPSLHSKKKSRDSNRSLKVKCERKIPATPPPPKEPDFIITASEGSLDYLRSCLAIRKTLTKKGKVEGDRWENGSIELRAETRRCLFSWPRQWKGAESWKDKIKTFPCSQLGTSNESNCLSKAFLLCIFILFGGTFPQFLRVSFAY